MTRFILNGTLREVSMEPGRTVLDHLRLHERLIGTKEGCAEGDCGACTVALARPDLDGTLSFRAVNSCIMLAAELDGCAVVTTEGLAAEDALHPVQQALVESHGSQCGFCTPGFVMSLYAHTQTPEPETPETKREEILDALAGNLCRCTGYRPIVAAAETLHHMPDPRLANWAQELGGATDDTGPRSLEDLDAAFAAAPHAKLVAGSTDLGVPLAKDGKIPAQMIRITRIPALREISEQEDHLRIGAAATYSEILPSLQRFFPRFAAQVRRIGAVQIRNAGTMGGNLCNASPIGDSAPCLIALGATLILRSAEGERQVPVEAFFTAYRKTDLKPGEYLRAIEIPYLKPDESFYAYKLAKRFDQDISTTAAAFKLRVAAGGIAACRVGFGGMAATPLRARALEDVLIGNHLAPESFAKAAELVPGLFKPLSDFRASADYRLQGAAGFLHRLGAEASDATATADIWSL